MNIYDTANRLAGEIRGSEECRELARLREAAYADETNRALLKEYKRLQLPVQVREGGGAGRVPEGGGGGDRGVASLLYMNPDVQAYLLAEMQMQKTLADVFKILTDAAGLSLELPGGD